MIYHFIFGLRKDFGNKPFDYFHYLAIKSCYLTQNKPTIWMHCVCEPEKNIWWDKAKNYFTVITYNKLPDIVLKCNNIEVKRIQHQADILRLLILKEHGGVYADIDTLFYRPFFPHFDDKKFVLGKEGQIHKDKNNRFLTSGLCNALIISEKNSEFVNLWLDMYPKHYSHKDWNLMSVRMPNRLSIHHKELIHVEPVESFHKFLWSKRFYDDSIVDEPWVLDYESGDAGIFSKHLYETNTYKFLKKMNINSVMNSDCLYAKMCRNIEGLL